MSSSATYDKVHLALLPMMSYDHSVKTLTVRLPDSLVAEIERESSARRVSKSDIVRERLHQRRRAAAGGGSTTELIGDILQQSWKAKISPELPRFHPKKQRLADSIRAKKLHR